MGAPGAQPAVLAAGALIWREKHGVVQVMLVHRPRYGDWSIPKGKLEARESFPAAAVREVGEETGYRVRLHRPLPASVYLLPDGRSKIVQYWTAAVRSRIGPGPKNPKEIDETRWVELDEAAQLLTRQSDRVTLRALTDQLEEEAALTSPIIIQRHAAAVSRSKWRDGEKSRPLNSKGKKQAKALPPMLDAFAPESVVSSPWKRCRATVQPFAKRSGLDISTKEPLTEAGHTSEPSRTAAIVERVLREARPTVLCTHRPVLPTVIGTVREFATREAGLELPRENPYLAAGEALVVHAAAGGRIVAVERHQPRID
ncbi:NUDIX hydrolase [Brachybacterium endophyticum]|uniref:NUDIX hydrolase n=2 Tax=Brachybacterium endophyticum TaxID=2182385 RepID=A0A2U2RKX4_9MICO|nr:NUDIX hydrolase [Brachybacterium endophyticum]